MEATHVKEIYGRRIDLGREKKDTFAEDWSREWDEITNELNPKKGREPELTDVEKAYRKGASAVWELSKKIALYTKDGGYNSQELMVIFNTDDPHKVFKKYTAQEALEKIREYEKEQGAAVPSEKNKEVERLKCLRVQYENRRQAFFEAGKFDMANRYIEKLKDIDNMIREIQGGCR